MKTLQELKESAEALKNSRFNHGEQVLFCVDFAHFTDIKISSRLFSKAETALNFANKFRSDDFVQVYPVNDIWNNPKQVCFD